MCYTFVFNGVLALVETDLIENIFERYIMEDFKSQN